MMTHAATFTRRHKTLAGVALSLATATGAGGGIGGISFISGTSPLSAGVAEGAGLAAAVGFFTVNLPPGLMAPGRVIFNVLRCVMPTLADAFAGAFSGAAGAFSAGGGTAED